MVQLDRRLSERIVEQLASQAKEIYAALEPATLQGHRLEAAARAEALQRTLDELSAISARLSL